ncbi:MAG: hypothetical protein IPG06_22285 [Haliea sp.]|nr:hypothetical protein [Haliea sp.]
MLSDERDGYTNALYEHDDYDNLNQSSIKGSLAWQATETLDINLIADYSDSSEICCFGNPVGYNREASLVRDPAVGLNDYYLRTAQANFNTQATLLNLDPDDRETQLNSLPSNDNTEKGCGDRRQLGPGLCRTAFDQRLPRLEIQLQRRL